MNKDRILQKLKKDVRSLLIASKLGLSIQELEHDYRMMIGSPLPLKSLDYRSTMELLLDMPDVVNIRTNIDGTVMLSGVVNEETKSIAELVSRQKNSVKKKGVLKRRITRPVSHMDLVRRGRVAPVLPASVKSDLRDLLSISPLLVAQLETSYYKRFGRSFQYTRYGFYSLIEVLRSVSDFVQVQQTKVGSLLMLKTPVNNRILQSDFQRPNSENIFKGTSSVSVKKDQSSPKISLATERPLPSTVPQSANITTLDKLFMEAATQFFASNPIAKGPSERRMDSEIVCSPVRNEHLDIENGITTNSRQSSTAQSSANKAVSEPILPIEPIPLIDTDSSRSPNLNTGIIKAEIAKPSTDCSLQCLEEKFDKDLKLCLSQTRAGFVIGNDLRQDIKNVVCKHTEGLPISQLLSAFKQYTGKELPFQELGFMSVLDLVGSLGDLLYLEDSKDGQDWRLFDIESKNKKHEHGETTGAPADTITRWDYYTEKPERLKPPVIISPVDGKILWSHVDVPVPVTGPEIPPDAVRQQKLCSLSRMKRGFMVGVYVENVTSPSEFYIRCFSRDTSLKLEDMMMEMRFCYANECVSNRYIVPDKYVTVGEIFALNVDGDVWWYRVIIHAVISSEEVQVFYPDYGSVAVVKRCWLRFLKSCYMTLPAQAVPASLAFLKPFQDQWSNEAIQLFQKQCARGPLVGVILQYVSDQLCLFLCDTSTDEDLYLHQFLIDKGHASLSQEAGFYKTHNPFMRYLIQSSEQPQNISEDSSDQSELTTDEFLEVHLQEPVLQNRVEEEAETELLCLEANPVGEDIWDEKWPFSRSMSSLNAAAKPQDQEVKTKLEVSISKCDGEQLSQPLEEFYISLIEPKNTSKTSTILQSPPRKREELERTVQPAVKPNDHTLSLSPREEKLQFLEDNCLFYESSSLNQTGSSGIPLMGFQKFQIPRSSTIVALGPAARLAATSGSLLHWVTEPRKV
ncbi:tudor domain-containing protein 5 [Leptodactylus fuscus]|uniref:tudor domain-containing protein 5 n=1 Tax=Leptodactylus fuscus TaxID=238119 RepID=UPI003F4EA93E